MGLAGPRIGEMSGELFDPFMRCLFRGQDTSLLAEQSLTIGLDMADLLHHSNLVCIHGIEKRHADAKDMLFGGTPDNLGRCDEIATEHRHPKADDRTGFKLFRGIERQAAVADIVDAGAPARELCLVHNLNRNTGRMANITSQFIDSQCLGGHCGAKDRLVAFLACDNTEKLTAFPFLVAALQPMGQNRSTFQQNPNNEQSHLSKCA